MNTYIKGAKRKVYIIIPKETIPTTFEIGKY